MTGYTFRPIGKIRSCFTEKFGIPRQPGLVKEASADLEIFPEFQREEAFRGLEQFSHIWILFVFHACVRRPWKNTVRPPRLGGNQRVGVFASRSGFRPNPIGQSVVALSAVETSHQRLVLRLRGIDLLDGTPVLDIKPYLPYADSIPGAAPGYTGEEPPSLFSVTFSEQALAACREMERQRPGLELLIRNLLALDPRPAYHGRCGSHARYGMRLWCWNILFRIQGTLVHVDQIDPLTGSDSDNGFDRV